MVTGYILMGAFLLIVLVIAVHDLTQKKHPILRNFPVLGHGRYLLEELGPKIRQYIVAGNNEERPFTRDQRHWIYRSASNGNNYFGFGTDNDLEQTSGYLIVKQSTFPIHDIQPEDPKYDPQYRIPVAKILGGPRNRRLAFRPNSVINVSAMSYGSLSAPAVQAINRGCAIADCLQNTGEGGIAPHHDWGGGLIWQLGTGYYGARRADGGFDENKFIDTCDQFQVKAIEIKLSQGAKPGRGGSCLAVRSPLRSRIFVELKLEKAASHRTRTLNFPTQMSSLTLLNGSPKNQVYRLGLSLQLENSISGRSWPN